MLPVFTLFIDPEDQKGMVYFVVYLFCKKYLDVNN